ncbi:pyridoxamine 5'-phosphate oxidase [Candidatus Nitrosotenuis cloacae]|uniref:Pyridoxamine 5'-phosphate oxidase n=2 Tax=Candidatus Nitrosotenuis cloacae TaxID=1603555 RepID=A0A3G1B5W8_9ARCH|nr:pyridoxamine 5'-phosphate oxidase [Candidatus Nitrosotenuis cloacae]
MMSSDKFATLSGHKYINLETYKKSGQAVRTPVWFVISDEQIFVLTSQNTGKIKRIRNNPTIKIMPCGIRGDSKGEWVEGLARIATEPEMQNTIRLRYKKYGFRAKIIGLFKKDNLAGIAVKI